MYVKFLQFTRAWSSPRGIWLNATFEFLVGDHRRKYHVFPFSIPQLLHSYAVFGCTYLYLAWN